MKRLRIFTVKLQDGPSTPLERVRLMNPEHRVDDEYIERFATDEYAISVINVEDTLDLVVAHPKHDNQADVCDRVRKLYASGAKLARDSVHIDFPLAIATSKAPMTIFFNVLRNERLDVQVGNQIRYAYRVSNPVPAWRTGVATVVTVHSEYVVVRPKNAARHKVVPRENLLLVMSNEEKGESWGD